ncbi:Ig domain-containing protein [Pseudomonas citronellolis]|uniref:Ig domain-containing protein n=1 Tax=Pseudomonas citronellolis TaxID=53408 RepID=A0A1A9KBK7_9PSED|nr:phage tail tube protein [Pseudomonas citronellolis]ANI14480.1 Ig domain-containing protein [Pseudomonas citronellolis]
MACKKLKFPGKDVVLEYVIGCSDELPAEIDWLRFGSLRTKEFEISWDTADATDADSVGSLRENLATFQSMTISGDGTVKASGAGAQNLIDLTKHVANPVATGGQPAAWLRMTFPDLTFIAYCLISTLSRSAPYDDVTTYSFEASATASDFGLIVEDTPDADAPDPASIQVVPETLTLTVGEGFNFEGVVLPVGAPQGLRWTSSAPSVAAVNQVSGEVTALSAGSATITAASSVAPGITDTASVTVVPLVQGITVSPTSVSVEEGATQQLTAAVSPVGAASGLVYESAAPGIATVNSTGLVTGVAAGTTTVKITSAARPSVSVTVPVTVTEA